MERGNCRGNLMGLVFICQVFLGHLNRRVVHSVIKNLFLRCTSGKRVLFAPAVSDPKGSVTPTINIQPSHNRGNGNYSPQR